MKTFGNIVKYSVYVIIAIIMIFLGWRIFFAYDHRTFSDINVSEEIKNVYDSDGKFLSNHIHNEHSTYGFFTAYSFVYIPEINQLQVTVRYNVSILESLGIPKGEHPNIFLSLNDDKTYTFNEIDKDEYISPSEVSYDSKLFYEYMRLVFNDVPDCNDKNVMLMLRIRDSGNSDENNLDKIASYHVLHYAEQPFEKYKLSGKEKKAIKEFNGG